ncbi:MAG: vitamin K epoxide reductase family protein [Chthoniobacterales bacterium]
MNQPASGIADSHVQMPGRPIRRVECVLYITAALLALVGLADSVYLTLHHLTGKDVDCLASGECETVLTSAYAAIGKFPLAGLGALAYFAVFSLAILGAFERDWAAPFYLLIVGAMLAATCFLLYVQAFVLHAFCDFCLLSAALTVLLSVIGFGLFLNRKKVQRDSRSRVP